MKEFTARIILLLPDKSAHLAWLLQKANQLEEAEPLVRRALEIDEKTYGTDDPVVAGVLNHLAWILKPTNRAAEAEPLMWRALAIDERAYGPDHPSVANDLSDLALLLEHLDRIDEAERLMRRHLEILWKFTTATEFALPEPRSWRHWE